jgi:hypothetical protein
MSDLKKLLADGDPVAREPGMSDDAVRAMRRTILAEARLQAEWTPSAWRLKPLALAAAVTVCLAIGVSIGMRLAGDGSQSGTSMPPAAAAPATNDARRQLQITSPGGTRIIWTFHQELDL